MATVPRFRIDVDIHNLLLPRARSNFQFMSGLDAIQLSGSNGPTKPIRIDNARTRTIGACARVLCKMAHDLIHIGFPRGSRENRLVSVLPNPSSDVRLLPT